MNPTDRLRLAVFIDFDNIEIGIKNTVGGSFDAGLVLEALKERGEVVSKTAYSDWQRAAGYSRMLTQHAIRMVQRNVTPGGDKNGADINLALDALEMAFTHPHINAFVIVGGDSDFISLVEKLKQYDKKVFVIGGRQFTSQILQRNCHEFIAYENLAPASGRRGGGGPARAERSTIDQAIPLVRRALKVLSEREVSPQLGLLKSTLLQLDSTFSERTYGASTFRDFAHKLEQVGVLKVHQAKGGWLVAPANGSAETAATESSPEINGAPQLSRPATPAHPPAPAQVGNAADGVRELRRLLEAAEVRRWPLYLRQIKQVVRKVEPGFDERAYGFATLMDLLRAANREGVLRVERDRQGGLRVFQPATTAAVQRPSPAAGPVVPVSDEESVSMSGETRPAAIEHEPHRDDEPVTEVAAEPPPAPPARRPRTRRAAGEGGRTPRASRARTKAPAKS